MLGMLLANSPCMNTAPVLQTSVQLNVGPSTAPGADNTANAGGPQSTFAGALNAAGAKPGRRSGTSKQSDDGTSGGSLPPAGNQSPPVPQPQAAATAGEKGGSAWLKPMLIAGAEVPAGTPTLGDPLAGLTFHPYGRSRMYS